ncbi:MAG: DUF4065 domain-containing protein [Planctomycetaceae bacterium]|nr:DUF4065 domain-containing protein [Planctomycetaceae bacterium]
MPSSEPKCLIEATIAALAGAGGRLNIVLTNKALFYADLIALRDFGETLTGAPYLALENGPVVAKYEKRMVRELAKLGLAEQGAEGMARPLRLTAAGSNFKPQKLSPERFALAFEQGRRLAAKTSTAASHDSHANPGWRVAWAAGLGCEKSAQVIDMMLALQDPFLDSDDEDDDASLESGIAASFDRAETAPWSEWK